MVTVLFLDMTTASRTAAHAEVAVEATHGVEVAARDVEVAVEVEVVAVPANPLVQKRSSTQNWMRTKYAAQQSSFTCSSLTHLA